MSVAYGSPAPSYGSPYDAKGGHSQACRLRTSVRKAFLDCEQALLEWEEAHQHSRSVLEALSNAARRRAEFAAAEGKLGVLSEARFECAEKLLSLRLVQSMERLLMALHPVGKDFEDTCSKVERAYEALVKDQLELQSSCSLSELWEGSYSAQPSVADMIEWLQDLVNALHKETTLRCALMREVGCEYDESLRRAVDLWDAGVFYSKDGFRHRLDAVKIHCVTNG